MPTDPEIRTFIVDHFSRDEFERFCADNFREVYLSYHGSTVTLQAYAQALVEYCARRDQTQALLEALARARPAPYAARLAAGRPMQPPTSTPSAPRARRRGLAPIIALVAGVALIVIVMGLLARAVPAQPAPTLTPAVGASAGAASATADPCPAAAPMSEEALTATARVTGTTFVMGDAAGQDSTAKPAHPAQVDTFDMDVHEVTNRQYRAFIVATGRAAPEGWTDGEFPVGEAFFPVVDVTWEEARAYCQWSGKRLPTEAEWELACRGADSRVFPWGDEWRLAHANTDEAGCGRVIQVGSYSPWGDSPYGARDLVGNAAEWVSSLYRSYPYRADDREDDQDLSGNRGVRGGSWGEKHAAASCVARGMAPAQDFALDRIGFRCARTVATP